MYRYYKDVFIFFALKFSLLYLLKTRNIQRDRTHPSTRHFILYQIFLVYHDGTVSSRVQIKWRLSKNMLYAFSRMKHFSASLLFIFLINIFSGFSSVPTGITLWPAMPQMYLDLSAGDILNPCWEGDKVVDVVATFFPFTYKRIFWHTVFRIQKR